MDYEEKKKRQFYRVLIAEIGMVLSVIAIVVITTLAAMGFFITSDGNIEQSGLMQIHSLPTGATVELDGSVLFSRTNLSRTMAAGEHTLKLYRDRYDTWEKTIKMYSGVLVRLYYPRLFLQDRTVSEVRPLAKELEFYAPSQSGNYILYAEKGALEWKLLDVKGDEVKETVLDLTEVLPGVESATNATTEDTFAGSIAGVRWSGNDERVLVKVTYEDKNDWILVNLRDVKDSLNLTKTFGLNFDKIEMINTSANQLFVLENHQLRKINVADGAISKVLLDNIGDFANSGTNVIYVTNKAKEGERTVGVYRDGEKSGTNIAQVKESAKVQIALARYYDEDYMCYTVDDKPVVLYGSLPSYDEKRTNVLDLGNLLGDDVAYSVMPNNLAISVGNEFLVARNGQKFMVIDLEQGDLYEYDAPTTGLNWLDSSMMYVVKDGEIIVWDFDGTNKRNLSESVAENKAKVLDRPVVIASNNRWLYYLVLDDKDNTITLMREQIRD